MAICARCPSWLPTAQFGFTNTRLAHAVEAANDRCTRSTRASRPAAFAAKNVNGTRATTSTAESAPTRAERAKQPANRLCGVLR